MIRSPAEMLRNLVLFVPLLSVAASFNEDLAHAVESQRRGNLDQARSEFVRTRAAAQAARDQPVAIAALAGMAQVDLALGRYQECVSEASDGLKQTRRCLSRCLIRQTRRISFFQRA